MAIKYIPYFPNTLEGQALLDNFVRTKRVLRYRDNDKVVERIERGIDHSLLFQLADSHGGQMFTPDNIGGLADAIINNNEIADTVVVTSKTLRIIDWLPILLLALAFLSAEWFLRKFWGMD